MLASAIPYKFSLPWASSAASGYVTAAIPASTASPAASQALGFPPATATPIGAGGTPPSIADMNGALSYESLWSQWYQAGAPVGYDAAFSSAIGGYPVGAILPSAAMIGASWLSTVDNNTSDPDTGGGNWTFIAPAVWSETVWTDTGSVNSAVITLDPYPTFLSFLAGVRLQIKSVATNTAPMVLTINGHATIAEINPDGTALNPGQVVASGVYGVVYDGVNAQLVGASSPPKFRRFNITATGAYSGNAPSWATRFEAWVTGGGGAGGGGDGTYSGAGGGAGGTADYAGSVTGGAAYSGVVGAGGTCPNASSNGSDGAASTLIVAAVTYQGNAGQGGVHGASPGGGQGGTASGTGVLVVAGGAGGDGATNSTSYAGNGGASFWGGGGRGARTYGGGQLGYAFGSGGGGGYSAGASTVVGGDGAPGIVVLKFYSS